LPSGAITDTLGVVVRVLTVDDHASFRRAAHALVAATDGFEDAGDVETGEQALAAADHLDPDLILMDVRLPGMDGCEASRRIAAAHPGIVVILVSSADEPLRGEDPSTCAAAAVVRKDTLRPCVLHDLWEAHRPDRTPVGGKDAGGRTS
jgi:DNA-binding NarL/FixJ family response regulator